MNKMLLKEKNVEKEKEVESYLSQISARLLTSFNYYAENSLAFIANWLELQSWYARNIISFSKIHVRMSVVSLLAFVDSYSDI